MNGVTKFVPLGVMAVAGILVLAACDALTAPSGSEAALAAPPASEVGPAVARDSLMAADQQPVPCCSVDSSGGTVTVVGGTLTFHRLATYTDTVATPGGLMSAACVTEVPNGAWVHANNGLVTLGDSVGYLTIPCSTGTYALVLSRRVDRPGGPSDTLDDTLSVGSYDITNQIPDQLTLVDGPAGADLTTALSWDTVTVAAHGHQYRFVATWTR